MKGLIKQLLPVSLRSKLISQLPSIYHRHISYSQSGEDLIILSLLNLLHGDRPYFYIDIGANHPYRLSNTALLYLLGGSGILVEPDQSYVRLLTKRRKRDKVLSCGVHFEGAMQAKLFVFDSPTLNTFSESEKNRYISMGHTLVNELSVDLVDINFVLAMLPSIDFLNIDIEGLDEDVLRKVDWTLYRPSSVCVETIKYEKFREPKKLTDIIDFMRSVDYMLYADTFINTIFVDKYQWLNRYEQVPKTKAPDE